MQIEIDQFSEHKNSQLLKKRNLKPASNLKKVFKLINQHLYGKLKHTDTGTKARSKQIIYLLFCKLIDERETDDNKELFFQIRYGEKKEKQKLLERIQDFFEKSIKQRYPNTFSKDDNINLNKELIYLIVSKIQDISLFQSSKDILSDAYEIFVSRSLKEDGGQFFTPPNVVKFMVKYLNPEIDSKIADPACGHGGFLLESKSQIWSKIKKKFVGKDDLIESEKIKVVYNLYGIDKDSFLSKISKIYLEILSNGKSNIFCEDSLDPESYKPFVKTRIQEEFFDFVFTNPPFGAKIPIDIKEILQRYELGYVWKNTSGNRWDIQTNKLLKRQPPQILFIERCVQLLKEGGKLGIILPEGIFGNPSDRYIWEYLDRKGKILGIVSLNQNTFQPYTCNKTSILFFQKMEDPPIDYEIDFGIVENVGHDKDGKDLFILNSDGSKKINSEGEFTINDDLENLHIELKKAEPFNFLKKQKVFKLKYSQIKNKIFIPSYYNNVEKTLVKLKNDNKFALVSIKDLIKKKIIYSNKGGYIPRGSEIGSHVYGLGTIPFIRTSEFFSWELKLDSNKKTSREVYELYKDKQNIEVGDILLVKDGGPNLIGSIAYITELDTKIIIQSHIFQLKVLENNESFDSYLLLYLLNLDIVQKQIQAITFIQGTIATIGNRIMDIILPMPKAHMKRKEISDYIKEIINKKIEIRKKLYNLNLKTYFN